MKSPHRPPLDVGRRDVAALHRNAGVAEVDARLALGRGEVAEKRGGTVWRDRRRGGEPEEWHRRSRGSATVGVQSGAARRGGRPRSAVGNTEAVIEPRDMDPFFRPMSR